MEKKKKSLSKREGALVRTETHTTRPILEILKGSVIFLHKYAHLGRFSLRSPRLSVLKPLNRRFGPHRALVELVSITLSNCADVLTENDAPRMWSDRSPKGVGGQRWQTGELPGVKVKFCEIPVISIKMLAVWNIWHKWFCRQTSGVNGDFPAPSKRRRPVLGLGQPSY